MLPSQRHRALTGLVLLGVLILGIMLVGLKYVQADPQPGSAQNKVSNTTPTLPAIGPSATPEPVPSNETPLPILTPRVHSATTPLPTPAPSEPFNMVGTGTRSIFDPKVITEMSDIVVLGRVREIMPARWTTANGQRPANPHAADNSDKIFTPVFIDVEMYLKGQDQGQQLPIFAWGGTVGQDSSRWDSDNLYQFSEGERVLLFLNPYDSPLALNGSPFWALLDHYTIDSQDSANNSYQTLPLQELLDAIRSATP